MLKNFCLALALLTLTGCGGIIGGTLTNIASTGLTPLAATKTFEAGQSFLGIQPAAAPGGSGMDPVALKAWCDEFIRLNPDTAPPSMCEAS